MNTIRDCEGCKRRREAMVEAGRKMAQWIKHRIGPSPMDEFLRGTPSKESETDKQKT